MMSYLLKIFVGENPLIVASDFTEGVK